MSQQERKIRQANEVLRELDAVFPGGDGIRPLFQWQWSDSLVSLIPQFNGEGEPVYEYRCICGVDVKVHSAECRGSVAKVKIVKIPTFGLEGEFQSYSRCWVLCRWNAPPLLSEWIDAMGTDEDYPAHGRYLPVHRGLACVVIPPRTDPSEYQTISRYMVARMRQHQEDWRKEIELSKKRAQRLDLPIEDARGNVIREPDKNSPFWKIADAAKERLRKFNPDGMVGYTKEIENAPSD